MKKSDRFFVWRSFTGVADSYLRDIGAYLEARHGVTLWELRVLLGLRASDNGLRMADVATVAGVTRAGATKMVDRLEGSGLAARTSDDSDRRSRVVVISRKGGALLKKIRPELEGWIEDNFFAHLDDRQLKSLHRVMSSLADSRGTKIEPMDDRG